MGTDSRFRHSKFAPEAERQRDKAITTLLCALFILLLLVFAAGSANAVEGDADDDGILDTVDLDDDNDGIPDRNELTTNLDNDFDGDGTPDRLDLDSDGDGVFDLVESGANATILDTDNDGRIDDEFLDLPSGNGIADSVETAPDSGRFDHDGDGVEDTPVDSDADNAPDFRDLDSDNDGITDKVETAVDTDVDGTPDRLDLDSDNDTIWDLVEAGVAVSLDANKNGRIDETVSTGVNGLADDVETVADSGLADYDGDGVADSPLNSDSDSLPDFRDPDSDSDGVTDRKETAADADGDGTANYLDLDSDNDGISDKIETDADTDQDQIPDLLDLDTDNDSIADLIESGANASVLDLDNDGRIDLTFAVGLNGLANRVETAIDSGIVDYNGDDIVDSPRNTDADLLANFRDADSDQDGFSDLIESGRPDADNNRQIDNFVDSNSDGMDDNIVADILLLPDANNDKIPDYRDPDVPVKSGGSPLPPVSDQENSDTLQTGVRGIGSLDIAFLWLMGVVLLGRLSKPRFAVSENNK